MRAFLNLLASLSVGAALALGMPGQRQRPPSPGVVTDDGVWCMEARWRIGYHITQARLEIIAADMVKLLSDAASKCRGAGPEEY